MWTGGFSIFCAVSAAQIPTSRRAGLRPDRPRPRGGPAPRSRPERHRQHQRGADERHGIERRDIEEDTLGESGHRDGTAQPDCRPVGHESGARHSTSARTSGRLAPGAIRIPTSRVRWLTSQETTAKMPPAASNKPTSANTVINQAARRGLRSAGARPGHRLAQERGRGGRIAAGPYRNERKRPLVSPYVVEIR